MVKGGRLTFTFRGKSGVDHEIELADPRLARLVQACRELPGYNVVPVLRRERQPAYGGLQ